MLGKSPAWQDAGGRAAVTSSQDERLCVAARLRQRRVLEAAPLSRLRRSGRGADQPPARRPLPRSGAVRVRAHLRAAPATGAGGGLAGDAPSRPSAAARPARRGPNVFARRALLGQREPDRATRSSCTSTTRRDELALGPFTFASARCRITRPRYAVELASDGGRQLTYSADCSPNNELPRVRARHGRAADRGDVAAPEANRKRGHLHPARGRRARAASARAQRLVLTHFSDELDPDWAWPRPRRRLAAGRARPRGRATTRV